MGPALLAIWLTVYVLIIAGSIVAAGVHAAKSYDGEDRVGAFIGIAAMIGWSWPIAIAVAPFAAILAGVGFLLFRLGNHLGAKQ